MSPQHKEFLEHVLSILIFIKTWLTPDNGLREAVLEFLQFHTREACECLVYFA